MKPGLPQAITTDTELWLPFKDGSISDESGNALTITSQGSIAPKWAAGYYGDGLTFSQATGQYSRLHVASAAGINFANDFTLDLAVRVDDYSAELPVLSRLATTGGENNAWYVRIGHSSCSIKVWNSAGSTDTLQGSWLGTDEVSRLTQFRFVVDTTNGFLHIFRDGQLLATKTTALANIRTASLGVLQVGSEVSTTQNKDFIGVLSDVQLRSVADTSLTSLPVNINSEPKTGRKFWLVDLDLRENITDLSWTDDGSGGFFIDLDDLTLNPFLISEGDIIRVSSTVDGVTTERIRGWAVTDIHSHFNEYFHDTINGLFYVDFDPATVDVLEIVIRARLSNKGIARGNRYYVGCLSNVSPGDRRMAWFDQPYPTGGGAKLVIASQHPDWIAGIVNEETSRVSFNGSNVQIQMLSDGMPWSEAITVFRGYVDEPPDENEDTVSINILPESGRFYRLALTDQVATRAEFPDMDQAYIGQAFSWVWGREHKRVPLINIGPLEQSPSGIVGWKYKLANHPIAAIEGLGFGLATGLLMFDVDLDEATLWCQAAPENNPWVDCAGYGATITDPTSPASTFVRSWGNTSEAAIDAIDILQGWLTVLLGLTADDFGDTWADTATRVLVSWRMAEPAPDPSSVVGALQRFLAETRTNLYHSVVSGKWEWEDINKADSADWTLTDADVIRAHWFFDRSKLAKRANAEAYTYTLTPQWTLIKGEATTLELDADAKYDVKELWTPQGRSLTGFYTVDALTEWLTAIRPLLETPNLLGELLVSDRFMSAELMDVIDVQTSDFPSAATSRVRVYGVSPQANGVSLLVGSEELFSTDGTSSVTTREPIQSVIRYTYGDDAGTSLAVTGAWTAVSDDDSLFLFQGAFAIPENATNRLAAYGKRTGGAADSDLQLRIQDIDNNLTIATISGFGTSNAWETTTTFTNIPEEDTRCELQYYAEAGVSGTLYAAGWEIEEHATLTKVVNPAPTLRSMTTKRSGISLSTVNSQFLNLPGCRYFYIPSPVRVVIDFDLNGATSLEFGVYQRGATNNTLIWTSDPITSGTRQLLAEFWTQGNALCFLAYRKVGGANPIFYGFSMDYHNLI